MRHIVIHHIKYFIQNPTTAKIRMFPIYIKVEIQEKFEYLGHYNPWNCSNSQWEGNHKGLDGKRKSIRLKLLDRSRVHEIYIVFMHTNSTMCKRNLTTRPTNDRIPIMPYKSESLATMPWYRWRKRSRRRRYQEAVPKCLRKSFLSEIA